MIGLELDPLVLSNMPLDVLSDFLRKANAVIENLFSSNRTFRLHFHALRDMFSSLQFFLKGRQCLFVIQSTGLQACCNYHITRSHDLARVVLRQSCYTNQQVNTSC
jgi:hypothetical protein